MVDMTDSAKETTDPRIRRTRQLLQQALLELLQKKRFEEISVQDISAVSTINRATFYAHYTDKFALLECTVGTQFKELLKKRAVTFDGTCSSAMKNVLLSLCDYLAASPGVGSEGQNQPSPYMESAIIAILQRMILEGLQQHPSKSLLPAEATAATISGALYGAAGEWVRTPNRCSSNDYAELVVALVSPLMHPLTSVTAGRNHK
jgi:AcrR family transcriptional regulator